MKLEIWKSKENSLHMPNFDLKELKIFACSSNNVLNNNKNILSQNDLKALNKFINKIKKNHGDIFKNNSLTKKKINLKNLDDFKNFDQLVNDYQIYENSYEFDSSFDEISKAFGLEKIKIWNNNKENVENKEDYTLTEHEKMTMNILDNPLNNYCLGKNNSNNNYNICFSSIDNNPKTTLMIKNIPNKFSKEMLTKMIDKNHKNKYNYFYLPIDLENNCNMGYAFINFIKNIYIKDFFKEFNNKKWNIFHSEKICEIKYARYQGINYYKNIKKTNSFNNFLINIKN